MTIPSTASELPYAGDGVSVDFPITFIFDTSADLKVVTTDPDGNTTVLTSGFSVVGGGGAGGTLTLDDPLASGYTLTIIDDPERTQPVDYANNDSFPAETHEGALDRTVRQVKRLYQIVQRCIRVADGDPAAGDGMELDSVEVRKGKYLFFNAITGAVEYAVALATTALSQSIIAQLLNPQTAAELAATVTPTNYWYTEGDARRYGWSSSKTGAQNATVLATAASVWSNGGARIRLPAGIFSLSSFVVPAGRGLIMEGEGPTQTKLVHSTGGSMFTLGADDIQEFSLRDIKLEPSATSAKLLDWSGDYQAYSFEHKNVELHEGSSGNTTCVGLYIAGGTTSSHQKHYFKWEGGKVFGLGTAFSLYNGGAAAAANDLTANGFQIQGCAADGILVNQSAGNRFTGSVENCGDGASTYNYRIEGSISSENVYTGRLENNGAKVANVPYKISATAGPSNRVYATMTATPANYNDAFAPSGCLLFDNGIELSNVQERAKGLRRVLGAATTDYLMRYMLSTDTMGSFGRHGVRIDGRLSWAPGTNPSGWDTHLERVAIGGLQAQGGVANRMSNSGNVTGAITPDLSSGWVRRLVLTGNTTINLPTNPPAGGGMVTFLLIQDGTGGWTVTFNAAFKLAGGAYTMTATANKRDVISFMYSDTDATYQECGRSQNQG